MAAHQASPSLGFSRQQHWSGWFLLKYCVAIMTPVLQKLTILKPRDNQCLFLMEMFVLSYANILYIYPKLCLQVGSAFWLRTYLTNQYVTLRYCSSNLCKWNYLYGDLPFFKIQVNHFMAQDEPFGAKLSQNASYGWGAWCHSVLRHSFLSLTGC